MYHHPDGVGGGFHHWMGTGEPRENSCNKCGVTTPDFGEGVVSDHGPIPLWCPGARAAYNSHHFVGSETELTCAYCAVTITDETDPNTVEWECRSDERPPIPEDHPNFVADSDD